MRPRTGGGLNPERAATNSCALITVIYLGPAPGAAVIAPVTALRETGHHVHLVTRQPPAPDVGAAFDAVTAIPTGLLPAGQIRRGKLVLVPDRLPAGLRLLRLDAVRDADVLVAGDDLALPAAWVAVRRLRRRAATPGRPVAFRGLPAAIARLNT